MKNEYLLKWAKAAGIRSLKTMAQTALGLFTVGMAADEVKWSYVLSVSVVAGIYSMITSIAGLPEVEMDNSEDEPIN